MGLLVNYKSQVMTFVPDAAAGLARIQYDPPMAGVQRQTSVALAAPGADCGDWRGALKAELADPARIDRILDEGAERARPIAQATMAEVREKMGLR